MKADELDRTSKILLDSRRVASLVEAEEFFCRAQLHLEVDAEVLGHPAGRACVATIVNAGSRAFRGGVTVGGVGRDDLLEACVAVRQHLIGRVRHGPPTEATVTVAVGAEARTSHAIWASAHSWSVEVSDSPTPFDEHAWPVAGVAAGSLVVAEALQCLLGHPTAGRRTLRHSLWSLAGHGRPDEVPNELVLPDDWWLVGLGHLGQGVMWSILHLGHRNPGTLQLQDTDRVTKANLATGAFVAEASIGLRKTRLLAEIAERHGWETVLVERRFDGTHRQQDRDPRLVVVGVDNNRTRRRIGNTDADLVLDLGIGATPDTYDGVALRAFPGHRSPGDIRSWRSEPASRTAAVGDAYASAVRAGDLDACGAITIAGVAVGAACVGSFAGALAVAEAVRRASGGLPFDHIDLQLRSTSQPVAKAGEPRPCRFKSTPWSAGSST